MGLAEYFFVVCSIQWDQTANMLHNHKSRHGKTWITIFFRALDAIQVFLKVVHSKLSCLKLNLFKIHIFLLQYEEENDVKSH